MHVLIDCTNLEVIATHEHARALCALAYIQYANVDTVVMPCDENRPYAQFNDKELDKLYKSVIAKVDYVLKSGSYADTIARTRAVIVAATHLRLPFDVEFLEQQAACIDETDDRPYRISTGKDSPKPTKAKTWANEPQRNRPRGKPPGKPAARQLTENKGMPLPPPAPSLPQPSAARAAIPQPPKGMPLPPSPPKLPAPPASKAAAPAKPAKPKPTGPKAPRPDVATRPVQNGVRRPGPGKCGAVWDLADKLQAKSKDTPSIEAMLAAGEKEGLNAGNVRAEYRQWLKFNGLKK